MHLTLKFLGEIPPDRVDLLTPMIRAEADLCAPFEMHLGRLGAFPSVKRARVIILGIQAAAGLETLARGIESACTRIGFAPERRDFHPHLTLGRVRDNLSAGEGLKLRQALETTTIDSPGTGRVDSVQLYKSDLKPSGAVYTKLFSAPLQNINAGKAKHSPATR
jgi:2'-5' RNA ligase